MLRLVPKIYAPIYAQCLMSRPCLVSCLVLWRYACAKLTNLGLGQRALRTVLCD